MVWRALKEEFDPICTVPTVKYGGGNVKGWDCMSSSGVENLIVMDGNTAGEICSLSRREESSKKITCLVPYVSALH